MSSIEGIAHAFAHHAAPLPRSAYGRLADIVHFFFVGAGVFALEALHFAHFGIARPPSNGSAHASRNFMQVFGR